VARNTPVDAPSSGLCITTFRQPRLSRDCDSSCAKLL
jgi:hypothetical protein